MKDKRLFYFQFQAPVVSAIPYIDVPEAGAEALAYAWVYVEQEGLEVVSFGGVDYFKVISEDTGQVAYYRIDQLHSMMEVKEEPKKGGKLLEQDERQTEAVAQ